MKIKRVILENFRGYREKTAIDFNDLTVLVGRNDVGKSTVLQALNLFFNEGPDVKFDKGDLNVQSDTKECTVTVVFSDLPEKVVLDDSSETALSEEYLLNKDGDLEVVTTFGGTKSKTCIRAWHPTCPECCDLLQKKQKELQEIIKKSCILCEDMKSNPVMRKAIWAHFGEDRLQCKETDISVDKEDAKAVWEKLQSFLPVYSLFEADRKNTDGDDAVQDPMKSAARQFLKNEEVRKQLDEIARNVCDRLQSVADRTVKALEEMDPKVAKGLKPVIPSVDKLKWEDVFKNVSVAGEDGVPLNKRGSGVRRLVLISFFKAEAERRQRDKNTGVIYAIEEPETSQHHANQLILAKALKKLAEADNNTQVILTTHGNAMVKALGDTENVRLISDKEDGTKTVETVSDGLLGYPSLNEINYTAFGAITEEYHDELWGYLEEHGYIKENKKDGEYEREQKEKGNKRNYIKVKDGKVFDPQPISLSHYIRDQIHHPENKRNKRFTREELEQSVEEMREFIKAHREEDVGETTDW